jgi:hypothetical protein
MMHANLNTTTHFAKFVNSILGNMGSVMNHFVILLCQKHPVKYITRHIKLITKQVSI